jgi:23S rRNA U2552 (ribose-2'-O)-methylase RlmE/FtsJ
MKEHFKIETKIPLIPMEKNGMNDIFLNKELWNKLTIIKEKIDDKDIKEWDNVKKHTNEYELIYLSSRVRERDSIAKIKPLSRSYFKMWEMFYECGVPLFNGINCGHLAEGPGGFIQATTDIMKKNNLHYYCHGITLRSTERDIPGWKKANRFIKSNNVSIHYGQDGTGDLYKKKNMLHFADRVGLGSCAIVTADGGFDYSGDFNKQEEMSYKLLLCEIVTNLLVQQKDGFFIIKFFDIFTLLSIQLIYMTGCYYESFEIFKPKTSRMANSEKYIIFKKFKGISQEDIDILLNIIDTQIDYNKLSLYQDFETLSFVNAFINKIEEFNKLFSEQQLHSIEKTLDILEKKIPFDEIKETCQKYQIERASKWCRRYDVPINSNSCYLK